MDFLFEIGLEEVPARMIASAEAELLKRVTALLTRERLISTTAAKSFSTPRRLAILVSNVAPRQEDEAEEVQGPAAKIAFKDGVPGPAAIAFAKKNGVELSALRIVDTPKGEYIIATAHRPGKSAAEVLTAELPKEIAAIYWAKNMYWRAGKPEKFVRPVRWILALLGDEVVPVQFGGYTAGRVTYGHRVLHGAEPITIQSPESYASALEAAHVIADVEVRRHTIRKALDRVCRTIPNARWREDHALVDKMTHMTEWPSVIAGDFDPDYLTLPEEVLVTVMRDHQNYFAVETKDLSSFAEGGGPASVVNPLAPHFLAVLNTVADAAGEAVIRHGNARVLRARFNDARFFWDFDQRTGLLERQELLKQVVFHKDIGTYWEKAQHVRAIVGHLKVLSFEQGIKLDQFVDNSLDRAALIAKTDLTCELVKEFTELQGQIGGLYARHQGLGEPVAEMLYWQYQPKAANDPIPPSPAAQMLGLADRINTVVDMIAIGNLPTGSRDPFALRRTANGIIRILAEGQLPLKLSVVHEVGIRNSRFAKADVLRQECRTFLIERVEAYLRDSRGQSYDVVKAVMSVGVDDVRDVVARAEAVTAMRGSEDFIEVSAAFKRMKNILLQAVQSGIALSIQVQEELLEHPSERHLFDEARALAIKAKSSQIERDYIQALTTTAALRPLIDQFFQSVMVIAPDAMLRDNRLALLNRIHLDFSGIADFSEIVTAG